MCEFLKCGFDGAFNSDFRITKHLMVLCSLLCSVGKLLFECFNFCLHIGDGVCGSGQLCLHVCKGCKSGCLERRGCGTKALGNEMEWGTEIRQR